MRPIRALAVMACLLFPVALAAPAWAQDTQGGASMDPRKDDWVFIAAGVINGPTYTGSDKSRPAAGGAVMGRVGGFGVSPRVAGLAVDLVRDDADDVNLTFGPVARARFERSGSDLKDAVVEALGKRKTAIEAGFVAGVGFNGVFHRYDRADVSVDVRWDVAGAHEGMVVAPSITYQTPLSRGAALAISASGEFHDTGMSRYYWNVTPAQSATTGLVPFVASGGLNNVALFALGGVDLNGNLLDGGFSVLAGGGYQRLTGSAHDSPITRVRGKSDQLFVGIGLGYMFH